MIISGEKRKRKHTGWIGALILFMLLIVLLIYKTQDSKLTSIEPINNSSSISCGAEIVSGEYFIDNGHQFSGVSTQHQARVRSGKFSSMLNKVNQRGFSYIIEKPTPGKTYSAEVWRRGDEMKTGVLAVSSENPDVFYKETNQEVYNDGNWWQKLELIFTIPSNDKIGDITVFVYKNGGEKWIFFDDFSIKELVSESLNSDNFVPSTLKLYIDTEGEQKLRKIKERVIQDGVYRKSDDDWIKAKILEGDKQLTVNIRPKGDWPDHVIGVHPSYRIRTKSEESWFGKQNFSIQHPKTRGYILEWLFHQQLKSEDVLSTGYEFINVVKNNNDTVVYAQEEHFDKILLESQHRREGPIIKFTEDHFWDAYYVSRKMRRSGPEGDSGFNAYWSSKILPFKANKISKNKNLQDQFEIAQNLMLEFKHHNKPLANIFDLDRMAKYLALAEINIAHHGLVWHNQRFYYNPVTSLLEPIGFDAYGNNTPEESYSYLYSEKVYQRKNVVYEPMEKIFYHPDFLSKFFYYLHYYSSRSWYEKTMSQLDEQIAQREKFLQSSFPEYKFDKTHLEARVKKIRAVLFPFDEIVKVYSLNSNSDSNTIIVQNLFHFPLEIISAGTKSYDGKENLKYPVILFPQPKHKETSFDTLVVPKYAERISYRLPGTDSLFTSNILPWTNPKQEFPREKLLKVINTGDPNFYREEEDRYIVLNGTHNISVPWIIPADKELFIGPGTHLQLSEGAFILSFSPVNISGTPESPVIIEGIDQKSGSFTVLQSKKKSIISHAIFDGLNTLNFEGWTLTGAVNFYESVVDISNSIFKNNHCEDALNIIRSDFKINKSSFINTAFDAFDADFCNGTIENSVFNITGNDGADFSGSTVSIFDCLFQDIGDKGVSVGENSQVNTNNIEISSTNIGFASKDESTLKINDVDINNCQTAFTAYQKKPEFGPATIILGKYTLTNTKREFLIEPGSTLKRN